MNYSLTCTCGDVLNVTGASEADALNKMMAAGKEHMAAKHPDMKMTEQQLMDFTKANMKMA